MYIFLKPNESKDERKVNIIKFWRKLGYKLYSLIQTSDKIDEKLKEKIIPEFCLQYSRETMTSFLSKFESGEIEINYNETNAINVAEIASSYSDEEYKILLDKVKESLSELDEEYTILVNKLNSEEFKL